MFHKENVLYHEVSEYKVSFIKAMSILEMTRHKKKNSEMNEQIIYHSWVIVRCRENSSRQVMTECNLFLRDTLYFDQLLLVVL